MKFIKYSKYTGDDFGIDAQDLHEGSVRLPAAVRVSGAVLGVEFQRPGGPEAGHPAGARIRRSVPRGAARKDAAAAAVHVAGANGPAPREPGAEAGRRRPSYTRPTRAAARTGRQGSRNAASSSKSPTNRSTSWATKRSKICSARSANRASAVTIRATWRPASSRPDRASSTSSATP